jgi:hypothetical protein
MEDYDKKMAQAQEEEKEAKEKRNPSTPRVDEDTITCYFCP